MNEWELILLNTEFEDADIDRSDVGTFYLQASGVVKVSEAIDSLPKQARREVAREMITSLQQWCERWYGDAGIPHHLRNLLYALKAKYLKE